MNTQSEAEQEHFYDAYTQHGKKNTDEWGVYYMWPGKKRDSVGDMVILTSAQEKYHCGENKEKFPCGSTVNP